VPSYGRISDVEHDWGDNGEPSGFHVAGCLIGGTGKRGFLMTLFRAQSTRARSSVLALTVLTCLALCLGFAPAAQSALAVNHDRVVSAVPGATPAVNNGEVDSIVQVGNVMVVGGTFTQVTPVGGAATAKSYLFAFDVSTGHLMPNFNPVLNGGVNDLQPGPVAGSVYVGGAFTQLGGVNTSHVTLLDTTTGAVVGGFKAATTNGVVNAMAKRANRLILGGSFTTAGGVAHKGLASLSATTGALDSWMNSQVAGHHNTDPSGAQGAIGVRDLDVNAQGTRLVAIGNFTTVDNLPRDQIVMLSLADATAGVAADWQTTRYTPLCFNWAFDSYMRGVSFSPDGSYFAVTATGGYVADTLCDTAARFETSATGQDVQPTWIDYTGGDTLWSVTVTEKAVYVGGHNRWLNNSLASDQAGPGSVPRPGIAALNTTTGVPMKWNPGRNPRGAAVYALYATPTGLWMGSDTEYIGNHYQYKRPRLAFFPLVGGSPEASDATTTLPGTAYLGANPNSGNGNILYRVDAAGPTIGAVDNGPDWTADDDANPSPYRNDGSNISNNGPGATTDATVPATTPNAVFDDERWSPGDNPPMQWAFPVTAGVPIEVRLFFANRYSGTSQVGQRVFNVSLEGTEVLHNFDIVAAAGGDQTGHMEKFDITSPADGTVNIDFSHNVENPLINAIEIVRTDQAPPPPDTNSLRAVPVTTSGASGGAAVSDAGIDWTKVRGSFVAGGKVYYGKNDGTFNSRTYSAANGGTFGPEVKIDPYNDPNWAGIDTGSGNTYDGVPVALYGQMGGVAGMAYSAGKLYYVKNGDSNLYWRWFNADSGIIGSNENTANGPRDWTGTMGMFAANGKLYFVTKADGNLNSMTLTSDGPTGVSTPIDGPLLPGHNDWRARALFLVPGNQVPQNTPPTASFTQSCTDLVCGFNGSGSHDAEGPIASYAWNFGDSNSGANNTATGQSASHTFSGAGTYQVTLTVTDSGGLTNSQTTPVTVAVNQANPITYVASATGTANSKTPTVKVPAGVVAGDTLVMTAGLSNATSATAPTGWAVAGDQGAPATGTVSLRGKVWVKTATATDANSTVTVTQDAIHKATLAISAYRGVSTAQVTTTASTDTNSTNHGTPTGPVPNGSWVVSFWTEKSATSNTWTTPGTVSKRAEIHSAASSAVSEVVADSNGPRNGTVNGTTATTATAASRGVNFSIVLPPK
jgi:PKD repeat protein